MPRWERRMGRFVLFVISHLLLASHARVVKSVNHLRDEPLQGDAITYLDSSSLQQWTASSDMFQVPATVPGDLITDLVNAGVMEDPLYELNFKNSTLWDKNTWNFSTTFFVSNELQQQEEENEAEILLVFNGIKMGARIELNNVLLGTAQDQFLRYAFRVGRALLSRHEENKLVVSFDPDVPVNGRFMACTGGWDWAPYSDTSTAQGDGAYTFSKGIWKSVYLVRVASAAIVHVVPQIRYKGSYPVERLVDGHHAGFAVTVRVHLWSPRTIVGTVRVKGDWDGGSNSSGVIQLPADKEVVVNVTLTACARSIKLWWPVGTAPNPLETTSPALYNIAASFIPLATTGQQEISSTRRVGFRHFALVTGNDTDPDYVRDSVGKEGTSSMGFFWRINGVPIWSRGANVIPMDELEGRLDAEAHVQLVRSAVEGNMNTLRVWGGGMFLPKCFYDACDEMGVMVYHDMMYAQGHHGPQATHTQEAELRHNIRRLASHTSIVMWDGCNECQVYMNEDTGIYAKFVMTVVAEEDFSRAVWPSCPATGWKKGVDRLTSLPTGSALNTPDKSEKRPTIEVHGPYARSSGFPAVNGDPSLERFSPDIPIKISPEVDRMGIAHTNVYASEFGCVTMSSFESMAPTLDPLHWSIHGGAAPDHCSASGFHRHCVGGNVMAERNYPCDFVIDAYFDTEPGYYNGVGKAWFKRQLYHCMIGNALHMKSMIERRRSQNELGHLVWQLNEIWPTGGWGSLEYGNPSYPGQVVGGRWKPLHYFYRSCVFADVMATCGDGGICYIRNDAPRVFQGNISLKSIEIATGNVSWRKTFDNFVLPPGPGVMETFQIPSAISALEGSTHFLIIEVASDNGLQLSRNVLLLEPPKNIANLPRSSGIMLSIGDVASNGTVPIHVRARVPVALFVVLTTNAPGRFSDNAFPVVGGSALVHFIPFGGAVDMVNLKQTLRAEDLAEYVHPPVDQAQTTPLYDGRISRKQQEEKTLSVPLIGFSRLPFNQMSIRILGLATLLGSICILVLVLGVERVGPPLRGYLR